MTRANVSKSPTCNRNQKPKKTKEKKEARTPPPLSLYPSPVPANNLPTQLKIGGKTLVYLWGYIFFSRPKNKKQNGKKKDVR